MMDPLPSHLFYRDKAEELRQRAEHETLPALREQHLRIAAMYQSLADHAVDRPATTIGSAHPRISIPAGLLRRA